MCPRLPETWVVGAAVAVTAAVDSVREEAVVAAAAVAVVAVAAVAAAAAVAAVAAAVVAAAARVVKMAARPRHPSLSLSPQCRRPSR